MKNKNPFTLLDFLADEWAKKNPPPVPPDAEAVERFFREAYRMEDVLLDYSDEVTDAN